jgi:singapore isolate B (sub-type 7) whole genome shotgun sequence assembly, scaffold_4
LENNHLLDALFKRSLYQTDIPISQSILNRISSRTSLIITGHSLGGGIAALLSLCLQSQYPNHCYAYDPPGQTLSPRLCELTIPYVTSIVTGDDCIPRLSGNAFVCLQDNIASALCCCNCTKTELKKKLFFQCRDLNQLFYPSLDAVPEQKKRYLQQWLMHVAIED